jgi:hypothetical protein
MKTKMIIAATLVGAAVFTSINALMAEANKKNWTVISMKDDWKTVFAFEKN